jgi:type I restriction enzyme S subunit
MCAPCRLPPKAEQLEIVRRVQTLFAFSDRLEARLQAAQTAADRLTPSLLAKAFRGELVPQDPNDEPASELLKRLASSTTSVSKRGRRSKAAQ